MPMPPRPRPGLAAWIIIALFGSAGVFISGAGLYSLGHWIGFALRAEAAPGVVLRMVAVRRRGQVPVFHYETPAGDMAEARSRNSNSWARFAPGDAVTLRVDPLRRDWAEADSLALLLFGPLLALSFGAIPLGIAWLTWRAGTTPCDPDLPKRRTATTRWGGNLTIRDRATDGSISARALAWCLGLPAATLLALLAAFTGVNEILAARAAHRNTEWVQARVEAVETAGRLVNGQSLPYAYHPRLLFTTADGQRVRVSGKSSGSHRYVVGDMVALRYRRGAPDNAVESSIWDFWLRPAAFALGAILACIPLCLLLRWLLRNRKRASSAGGPAARA
jgi:hypothetical protein